MDCLNRGGLLRILPFHQRWKLPGRHLDKCRQHYQYNSRDSDSWCRILLASAGGFFNGGTTEASGGTWFYFYTLPGSFGKSSPADGATGQSSITLSWSASTGAAGYYYCFDTSDNDTCNTSWTGTSATSAAITTNPGTTYYWHVRSVFQGAYTYSDSDTWWSFSTAPANFGKNSPANGATSVSINPTLTWGTSTGATAFEYCYDLSNDSTCNGIGTWTNRA